MKKIFLLFILLFLVAIVSSGCAPAAEPTPSMPIAPTFTPSIVPPTNTPSSLPPTNTSTPVPPTSTPEPTSTATPLPGLEILPIDGFAKKVPWLPMDNTAIPAVNYLAFNVLKPPFDNALVRQAFAHAVDRQVLVDMAVRYRTNNPKPATSLTSPETLGRDLYNVVGAGFDPVKAKELLSEAGYPDPSAFPPVILLVNAYGDVAPGARFNMANAMAEMWQTNLGVLVKVEVVATFKAYGNRLRTDPPEIFWQGWVADQNDPDSFLRTIFHSDSEFNFGHFNNAEFDTLVDEAATTYQPADRQVLYIQAERLLCETEAALIPLYHFVYKP